jgi:uncharacterized protein (TIGR02246 family)
MALRVLFAFLVCSLPLHAAAECRALSEKDRAAIRAVIERYRTAWLAGDPRGVLDAFTDDAVLLPRHGDPPISGRKAIEQFWWPPGAAPFKLLEFELTVDEIGGCGPLAHARGADRISWSAVQGTKTKTFKQRGTYLAILRKAPDGSWRVTHRMWDDPVPDEISAP